MGSLFGGGGSTKQATGAALTGFNYLKGSPLESNYGAGGATANTAINDLLGVGGDPAKQQTAFNNYLNSSGYQFQQKAGQDAITTNLAAKGLLNSGAALKSLTSFGQGLGATSFQNYLNNLKGQAQSGQQAYEAIGQAGSSGGATAANAINAGAERQAGAFGSLVGGVLGFL